jgi:hypothetical protein
MRRTLLDALDTSRPIAMPMAMRRPGRGSGVGTGN